jgi:hypothetical protein
LRAATVFDFARFPAAGCDAACAFAAGRDVFTLESAAAFTCLFGLAALDAGLAPSAFEAAVALCPIANGEMQKQTTAKAQPALSHVCTVARYFCTNRNLYKPHAALFAATYETYLYRQKTKAQLELAL